MKGFNIEKLKEEEKEYLKPVRIGKSELEEIKKKSPAAYAWVRFWIEGEDDLDIFLKVFSP